MAIINGTAQADYLEGTNFNDTINGLGGDDQIDGGFGDDTLDGGDGIDSTTLQFYGQPGINFTLTDGVTVLTSFGTKTLLNFESVTISGTAYNDVITGGSGNDTIYGDSSFGGSANDILNGGAGNDYIDGGGGDDTMDGGDGVDSAYLSFQYLSSGVNLTLTDNVTVLTDRGTKSLLNFEAATINGSNYGDVITGGSGNDYINSGQGNDILNGGAGDDYIYNNLGDDSFDGGEGVDSTSLFFGNQSSSVNFTLTDNVTVHTDQGTKTLLNFEAVNIYGTNYDDVITGGSGNDYISGGFSGNDILNGGAGDDYLEDYSGDDTLDGGEGVDSTAIQFYDQVGVNFTLTDNVTVHTYNGIKTLLNFEAAQIGGSQYDDVITGGSGRDYISGGSGNDILNGGAGDDYLSDRYGNDTLDGGEGIDSTDLDFRNETSGVNFDLEANVAVNTDDGTFTILNIEQAQIQGSQYDDSISGGLGSDRFSGDFGNDTFLGRGGVDYFYGGFGTDTAILLGSRVNYDITTKVDAQGFLNVIARDLRPDNSETGGGEYYHSIEFIQFSDGSLEVETGIFTPGNSAPTDLNLAGGSARENEDDGVLVGTVSGVDPDSGDQLSYSLVGDADGRFVIDASTGAITVANGLLLDYESAASHQITVQVTDLASGDYQETFTINVVDRPTQTYNGTSLANAFTAPTSEDWTINGLAGDDQLTSGRGKDVVRGGAGNDTINSGANDDTIAYFGAKEGFDLVNGGQGYDTIKALANNTIIGLQSISNVEAITANGFTGVTVAGSGLNDSFDFSSVLLTGIARIDSGAGNDQIKGSNAVDVLAGGGGLDILTGNGGNDFFAFAAANDSRLGTLSDIITDFAKGSDRIDLSAIDASSKVKGDQDFSFIGAQAFHKVAGELRAVVGGDGYVHVIGDTNGNGIGDFEIRLTGSMALSEWDFVL